MRLFCVLIALIVLCLPASALAQVKNPTIVEVASCPDHDQDTGHEIDIVRTDGTVLQTIQAGDPPSGGGGLVSFSINVQPVTFGSYTFVVRATATGVSSPDSPASDVWQRSPGSPSKPVAK